LCEIAQARAALIDDGDCKQSHVRGANMLTKQNLSKITEVVLLSLFALAALSVTLSAVLGPPSLWMVAR
jgi:hypothetical protein